MRPSSEDEALRMLQSYRFTVKGATIYAPPGSDPRNLSERQADVVAFLCQEHGYDFSDSPVPRGEQKVFFTGWLEAECLLAMSGFRYAKQGEDFIIVPPDRIDMDRQRKGWIRNTVDYLCEEWGYEVVSDETKASWEKMKAGLK